MYKIREHLHFCNAIVWTCAFCENWMRFPSFLFLIIKNVTWGPDFTGTSWHDQSGKIHKTASLWWWDPNEEDPDSHTKKRACRAWRGGCLVWEKCHGIQIQDSGLDHLDTLLWACSDHSWKPCHRDNWRTRVSFKCRLFPQIVFATPVLLQVVSFSLCLSFTTFRGPEVPSQFLCCILSMWLWARHVASLCPGFSLCKMGVSTYLIGLLSEDVFQLKTHAQQY